jgi:thymidylate kinase
MFRTTLSRHLPLDLVVRLQRAAATGDWTALAQMAPTVKSQVTRHHQGLFRWMRYAILTTRHYLHPPLNCFAAFIGPDGSGKSSVVEALAERLLNRPFKIVQHGKSNFGVLPPLKLFRNALGRLLGRKTPVQAQAAPGALHSGMIRPNPVRASLVYVAYYALDACLGRLLLRRWRGQCGLILFDRYFYDYYYQIGNRRTPKWYLRLCERLVPRPDLVFLLDREPGEIFARKPELTPEEIGLQQNLIREEFTGRPEVRVVDARTGLDATVRTVENLIIEHLVRQSPAQRGGRG